MIDENKKLLDEVIKERLNVAKDSEVTSEQSKLAFKEAMDAVDRKIELEKLEGSGKKESKWGTVLRCVEIGMPIVILVADFACKNHFMKKICTFEKDYTFTTTPGRSMSNLFRFKK